MKMLAVDLAAKHNGWARFDGAELQAHGVITVRKLDDRHAWMWQLFDEFRALPWDGVGHVVAEFPQRWLRASRRTSTKTMQRMYSARAVLLLACVAKGGPEVHEVEPGFWQKGMLSGWPGYPEDTKGAAIGVACQLWPFEKWEEHDADAALMGRWWVRMREWEGAGG